MAVSIAKPRNVKWYFEAFNVRTDSWVIRECETKKAAIKFADDCCRAGDFESIRYGWEIDRKVENAGSFA